MKLGIKKSNLTCRLARNWTDNLSSFQDLLQWSSVRTSDEQPRWTCLGYSVLSQSWWGLLRPFLALCLRVYQLTTLKRTKGSFFCPAVAIKATREKKIEESFLPLPNLHVSQLRSSQPSEQALLILMDRATSPSNTDGNVGKHNNLGTIHK